MASDVTYTQQTPSLCHYISQFEIGAVYIRIILTHQTKTPCMINDVIVPKPIF